MRAVHAIAIVALLALGPSAAAGDGGYQVIANPKSAVVEVDRDELRDIYLKKVIEERGESMRPLDLSSRFPAREQFIREVIRKTPAQLKSYWSQQIFTGKGVPPPEVDAVEAAIAYVVATPGAIAYIPAGTDPGHARVVKVR